jgi:uncharacterized protein (TIGR02996 family)
MPKRKHKFSKSEHEAFENIINRNPSDTTARKVFADYLEENGLHRGDKDLELLRSDEEGPVAVMKTRQGKTKAVKGVSHHATAEDDGHIIQAAIGATGHEIGPESIHPSSILRLREYWRGFRQMLHGGERDIVEANPRDAAGNFAVHLLRVGSGFYDSGEDWGPHTERLDHVASLFKPKELQQGDDGLYHFESIYPGDKDEDDTE